MGGIVIQDTELVGNRLTSSVVLPGKLRKYFKSSSVSIIYDADIKADESILNVPILALMLPFAWVTGTDIHVESIYKTFVESVDKLKLEYMEGCRARARHNSFFDECRYHHPLDIDIYN